MDKINLSQKANLLAHASPSSIRMGCDLWSPTYGISPFTHKAGLLLVVLLYTWQEMSVCLESQCFRHGVAGSNFY